MLPVKMHFSLCIHTVWPRGYKTFFMLNSAEHENFSANKYENANNSCMKISLLINMKMPTIVGIFLFISREIFMLSYV